MPSWDDVAPYVSWGIVVVLLLALGGCGIKSCKQKSEVEEVSKEKLAAEKELAKIKQEEITKEKAKYAAAQKELEELRKKAEAVAEKDRDARAKEEAEKKVKKLADDLEKQRKDFEKELADKREKDLKAREAEAERRLKELLPKKVEAVEPPKSYAVAPMDLPSQIRALEVEQSHRLFQMVNLKEEIRILRNNLNSGAVTWTQVTADKNRARTSPLPEIMGIKMNKVFDKVANQFVEVRDRDFVAPLAHIPFGGGGLISTSSAQKPETRKHLRGQLMEKNAELVALNSSYWATHWQLIAKKQAFQKSLFQARYTSLPFK